MRNLASSCNALVGKITTKKQLVKYACIVHHCPLMEMELGKLTFIAPIDLLLADEGRTVDLIAA